MQIEDIKTRIIDVLELRYNTRDFLFTYSRDDIEKRQVKIWLHTVLGAAVLRGFGKNDRACLYDALAMITKSQSRYESI
jgi:hypothetical protein